MQYYLVVSQLEGWIEGKYTAQQRWERYLQLILDTVRTIAVSVTSEKCKSNSFTYQHTADK